MDITCLLKIFDKNLFKCQQQFQEHELSISNKIAYPTFHAKLYISFKAKSIFTCD